MTIQRGGLPLVLVLAAGPVVEGAANAQQSAAPPPPSPYAPPPPPLGHPPAAYGARPAPLVPPPPPPEKHFGVGYKIGNGLGFVGADVIVSPVERLGIDLQMSYLSSSDASGTATGYGFAPSVQGRLKAGQVSTPYAGLGFLHASMTLNQVSASANGFFVNLGYEWRWESGVGILLGGGVSRLGTIHATDGITTIDQKGGLHPNLEASLRFMFL